jgi:hypothetical protein
MSAAGLILLSALLTVAVGSHVGLAGSTEEPTEGRAEERPFEGLKALVLEPENFWGWDAAIFGALQERGFEVGYVKPEVLDDFSVLSQHDLVASNIKRSFTTAQVANLKKFVAEGGAMYGSWGGPMGASDLLRDVCHVGRTASVRITGMSLLQDTPLVKGISETRALFPPTVGHQSRGSWEIVSVTPVTGGIPVAQDGAGNPLGVLGQYGKGRTAVLGFGPEQEKYFPKRAIGPAMMDNLLAWLLEAEVRHARRIESGTVEVSLPARAELLEVYLDGQRLPNPHVQEFGSLKKIRVNVQSVPPNTQATIRVTYKPLTNARNVETIIHLPWASFPRGGPPQKLAEWLGSVHATMCQPLLREANGVAYYQGMPEDIPDPGSVSGHRGNLLADFIAECHQRRIKVIGGIYFENRTTLKKHPEATVVKKNGERSTKQACFNRPEGQEFNLATVQHVLENYRLDGIILDDNFELQHYDCCCQYCSEGFQAYCGRKRIAWQEPSQISGEAMARHWAEYKLEGTRILAAKVARLAHDRNVVAGGWVSASPQAAHLALEFDFLGGMVYAEPPRAARLMLSVLGKCKFWTLLWAPGEMPERLEQEAREAVHAGSAAVGFWVYPPGHRGSGAFRMLEGSTEAIAHAFARVEEEWFHFYRDSLLAGDSRFAVLEGKVGRQELTLRIKNLGKKAAPRLQGNVDFKALMPVTMRKE